MQSPDFWTDHKRAGELSKELNDLKEEIDFWSEIEARLNNFLKLDEAALEAAADEVKSFRKQFDGAYTKIFLSGKYDKGSGLLYVFSGAGGVDAQDWAAMLFK